MQSPEAVFFDLDGTLIDTAPDMGGALNRLLSRYGRQPVEAHRYRPHVSHGSIALLKLGFTDIGVDTQKTAALRQEFLDEYANHIAAESALFDGVESILTTLESTNTPWGIITNKPEQLTLELLAQLELKDRCCCIVGADTAKRAKPHPEPMELACTLTGVAAPRCIYVGDAERDIQAGLSVGMTSLIAGWGYIDPVNDNPEQWGAFDFLSAPDELMRYL